MRTEAPGLLIVGNAREAFLCTADGALPFAGARIFEVERRGKED